MQKFIAVCFLLLGLNIQHKIFAQSVDPNAPIITLQKEIIDGGVMKYGADGTFEIKFKNTGKNLLKINNVTSNCGCVSTMYNGKKGWPEDVAPGKDGIITVKYDTKRAGAFSQTIIINSNASKPSITAIIKGKVDKSPMMR